MKAAIIIPARHASSRLPGKPLLAETGKSLIQHTYEQAVKSSAERVIIATDDTRIVDVAHGFGGEVVMTSSEHESGTARVAEAALKVDGGLDADIIVNMQGDEPEVDPVHLDMLIDVHERAMAAEAPVFASTLVCPFTGPSEGPGSPADPSCVKAVLTGEIDGIRRALYFSRALSPYPRDENGKVSNPSDYYLHIGLYDFSRESLQRFGSLPHGHLEYIEKLEQLRILEAGEAIVAAIVSGAAPGIDTPEDYAAFVARRAGV